MPLADVDVNVPGVIATLVAPVVAQLSVLLEPELIVVGLALNEVIVGPPPPVFTVTVAFDVAQPDPLVAVSVYVVVPVGLTLVVPLADAELNPPGEIAIVVAPLAVQVSMLLAPELMLAGFDVNDAIAGAEPVPGLEFDEVVAPPQPAKPAQASRTGTSAQRFRPGLSAIRFEELRPREPRFLLQRELGESMRNSSGAIGHTILVFADWRWLLVAGTASDSS